MRALLFGCFVLLLAAVFQGAEGQGKSTTLSLTLRVEMDEWDDTFKDFENLLAYAKEKKMKQSTMMLLRTASQKVGLSIKQIAEVKAQEEAKAARAAAAKADGPSVFTDDKVAVKPLKQATAAKTCTIPKFKPDEFDAALGAGKVDFTKPFLVSGAVPQLEAMQRKWNSERLMKNTELDLRYLSPVVAKQKRTFDQPQNTDEEQYEYTLIKFEKYFQNCFNHKAKPDFKKVPGSGTEHCEQNIAAGNLDPDSSNYTIPTFKRLSLPAQLDDGRKIFVDHKDDIQAMLGENANIGDWLGRSTSRFFVLGPSGAGEQLRQEGTPAVDALVHGKKRWFFMQPQQFIKLREVAKEVLEPGSAFMFFEQQFVELKEDFELGSKKLEFMECNQNPGEAIFIPGDMIQTSLSLLDSFSYRQHLSLSKDEVLQKVDKSVWEPSSGVIPNGYQAAACLNFDLSATGKFGKGVLQSMQGQIIQQLLQQNYGASPQAQNQLILNVLRECTAVALAPSLDASKTVCPLVWNDCTDALAKNLQAAKIPYPTWIPTQYAQHLDADSGDFSIPDPEKKKKKKKKKEL